MNSIHHIDEPRWAGLREVIAMAGPVVIASISVTAMGFVDTALVSRLGVDQLAAVGSAGLWAFICSTPFVGLASCVSTFVSQSIGRRQQANCARYAWQGIYISLATALVGFALWPVSPYIFGSMPHAREVIDLEILYFNIRLIGFCFYPLQTVLSAFFTAVGRPRVAMYVAFIANIVNAVLAWALIFGELGLPRMEVAGAGLATIIALAVQCALLFLVFLSREMQLEFSTRSSVGIDVAKIRELISIGWASGLTLLMDVLTWGVFTSYIVGRSGPVALAAHNATCSIISVSFMPVVGLNQAIAPIVGRWIGRGDIPRARGRAFTAMRLAMGYMFAMGISFGFFGGDMIRIFFTSETDVVTMGAKLLFLAGIFQIFDAVNITIMGALRGAGDTRWMAVVMASVAYGFFLPISLYFDRVMGLGAVGAWVGATVYIIVLSGILFMRFYGGRWGKISIFSDTFSA